MKYSVCVNQQADRDIEALIDYMEEKLFIPVIAENYSRGIYQTIAKLQINADIYAISHQKSIQKYGANARHVLYKDFAIIYTIEGSVVTVHRIIHGSLIT